MHNSQYIHEAHNKTSRSPLSKRLIKEIDITATSSLMLCPVWPVFLLHERPQGSTQRPSHGTSSLWPALPETPTVSIWAGDLVSFHLLRLMSVPPNFWVCSFVFPELMVSQTLIWKKPATAQLFDHLFEWKYSSKFYLF